MKSIATVLMTCFVVLSAICNFSFSKETNDSLSLYNTNGWKLLLVDPPPSDIFDTATTGMQILPTEGSVADSINLTWPGPVMGWFAGGQYCTSINMDASGIAIRSREGEPTDSVLLIHIDAISARAGTTNLYRYYGFFRKYLTGIIPPPSSYISVYVKVNGYSTIYEFEIGFGLYDFTNGIFEFGNEVVKLSPGWQRMEASWRTTELQNTEGIAITIYGRTPLDSMWLFMEIEFNDIVFHYNNGDSLMIDPFQYNMPSGIIEQLPGLPNGFVLHQNYPNPFNPSTKIRYEIPEPSFVKLTIYSLLGEKIADVVDEYQNSGIYEADFDASAFASGTYIYVLKTDRYTLRKKMILLK